MEYTTCKKDVFELVANATEEMGYGVHLIDKRVEDLNKICEYIDVLNDDFEYDQVDVSVDIGKRQVQIDIICFDMIMDNGRSSRFFDIMSLASSFAFTNVNGENIRLSIYVDGVWGD